VEKVEKAEKVEKSEKAEKVEKVNQHKRNDNLYIIFRNIKIFFDKIEFDIKNVSINILYD
jgi:hypothetical protein